MSKIIFKQGYDAISLPKKSHHIFRILKYIRIYFGQVFVPSFFNYAIADGIYNLLYPDKTALKENPKMHKIFNYVLSSAKNSGNSSLIYSLTKFNIYVNN